MEECFRPLLGIRFFDKDKNETTNRIGWVSVPYWGLDFLIGTRKTSF